MLVLLVNFFIISHVFYKVYSLVYDRNILRKKKQMDWLSIERTHQIKIIINLMEIYQIF